MTPEAIKRLAQLAGRAADKKIGPARGMLGADLLRGLIAAEVIALIRGWDDEIAARHSARDVEAIVSKAWQLDNLWQCDDPEE